jgi:hypothetical protein
LRFKEVGGDHPTDEIDPREILGIHRRVGNSKSRTLYGFFPSRVPRVLHQPDQEVVRETSGEDSGEDGFEEMSKSPLGDYLQ